MDDATRPWFETFFSGLWLEAQCQTWTTHQTEADTEAATRLLGLTAGARILDVPCGDGRVARALSRRGYAVTGLDFTSALLEEARKPSPATETAPPIWRHGDMRDLPFESEFDGAVCIWGSLGYGEEEDDRSFLEGVARALRPQGRFVLDLMVLESLLPDFQPSRWHWAGNVLVAEERHFDPGTSRVLSDWVLSRGAIVERKHSSIRIYSVRELSSLLARAGFGEFECFGSMDLEPFELGSTRLVLAATRMQDGE